ncbi:hypothetical protein CEXT_47011 [Caerostris extrusa]|uniref:Uncharacterized protein n=1 Tax=Caerostris extrusa TaxID=172846 RepID=A0AAV4N5H7_CAEEX|nr:hypothetical protein CEXT_47011 [Caerostris extrusa]
MSTQDASSHPISKTARAKLYHTRTQFSETERERGRESRKGGGGVRGTCFASFHVAGDTHRQATLFYRPTQAQQQCSTWACPGKASSCCPGSKGKCLFQGQTHQGPSPMDGTEPENQDLYGVRESSRQSRIPGIRELTHTT